MNDNNKLLNELRIRKMIEIRESQLWWLAVVVIMLLALGLIAVDSSSMPDKWWVSPRVQFVLNTRAVRIALVLAALVICAYFRDTAKSLRRDNAKLISDLAERSKHLERKNSNLARFKELSDQLIGVADLREALDLVLGMAVDMARADTASIMLRDKGSDTLRIVSSHGLPKETVESTRVKMGEAIAGRVAADGKPVILNTDELSGDMAERAAKGHVILSSVIIPIQVGEEIRGVVSAAKLRGRSCIGEEDMAALTTLANQASMVIQKADLLDDLRSQVDILGATVKKLKQAQAELMQSEKLASIGQLASGVAHEINNPLQVIMGRTELLLIRETDEAKTRDLESVLEHTLRISSIVSNLLSFSRQNADADFCDVEVNEVLDKTLSLLQPQMAPDDVVVAKHLGRSIPSVPGKAGQLQQVFTNIVMNAYQAMREEGGGTLTITSRRAHGSVEVVFADTGPGIPTEYLDNLFDPFFTTKPDGEGTGLGLSIAYGIVQSHGGTIEVASELGHGSRFTVVLPSRGTVKSKSWDPALNAENKRQAA